MTFASLILLFAGCRAGAPASGPVIPDYALSQPERTITLPGRIDEISGLSCAPDGRTVFAVDDEHGRVYTLDTATGDVIDERRIAGDHDFEGVEQLGDTLWAVASGGRLYRVDPGEGKIDAPRVDLQLRCDLEGLAHTDDSLLLACKARSGNGHSIYTWTPGADEASVYARVTPRSLAPVVPPGTDLDAFAPSALARHPLTGQLYLLSSAGELLVVLAAQAPHKPVSAVAVPRSVHRQPEGLCFDANGTMYVANEGRGKKARLMVIPAPR